MNYLIFRDFFKIKNQNFQLKINFSDILKCAGDVARSGASDRVTINGQRGEVTWQHAKRQIMPRIVTVDGHLRRRGT